MGKLQERDYQRRAVDQAWAQLRRRRAALVVLPTGAGKTLVFTQLAERWPGRVLIVTPRRDLVDRAVEELQRNTSLTIGIERGDERARRDEDVVCGTVQSLVRRLDLYDPAHFGIVIVDEADLARAPTYQKLLDHFPNAKVFGCTATPDRHDGKSLLELFEAVAYKESIENLVEAGYLCRIRRRRIRIINISRERIEEEFQRTKMTRGDFDPTWLDKIFSHEKELHEVVKPMLEVAGDRRTLVFGVSVHHAELLAALFNRYRPGCARAISGDDARRNETMADFRAGKFQFLCNCVLLNRGVDVPFVSCIGMARPTLSRTLYMQMLGRGTRIASGKKDLLVVDFTFNSEVHALTAADVLAGDRREEAALADEILDEDGEDDAIEAIAKAGDELAADERLRERIRAKVEFHQREVVGIDWDSVAWGEKTNTALANELGVHIGTIARYRPANIPTADARWQAKLRNEKIDWNEQPWSSETDAEIGRRLGVSHGVVRVHRPAGVRSPSNSGRRLVGVNWAKQPWATLGNKAIARRIGCDHGTVAAHRPKDIPSPTNYLAHVRSIDWEKIDWAQKTDTQISKETGIHAGTVARYRPETIPSPLKNKPPRTKKRNPHGGGVVLF